MFIPSRELEKTQMATPEGALWVALSKRDYEAANVIFAEHPAVNIQHPRDNKTLLQCAVSWRDMRLAEYLLARGADINAGSKAAVIGAGLTSTVHQSSQPLILAAAMGDSGIEMLKFLIAHDADVKIVSYPKETALHRAAQINAPQTMALLIEAGVDIDAENDLQQTALSMCVDRGFVQATELLLLAGADETITDGWTGMTPRQKAAVCKNVMARAKLEDVFKKCAAIPTPAKAKLIDDAAKAKTDAPLKKVKSIGFAKKSTGK